MNYQPLSVDKVFNLTQFQRNEEGLKAAIARLEVITAPTHDASEHKFEDDPDMRGICKHCGWLHPDVPADCSCGKSLQAHLIDHLKDLRDIRAGKVPTILEEIVKLALKLAPRDAEIVTVRMSIVDIDQAPEPRRRRGLFG